MVLSIIFAASLKPPDQDTLSSLLRAILVAMDIPIMLCGFRCGTNVPVPFQSFSDDFSNFELSVSVLRILVCDFQSFSISSAAAEN